MTSPAFGYFLISCLKVDQIVHRGEFRILTERYSSNADSLPVTLFSSSDLSGNGWLGRYLPPSCPSLLHPFILCFLPPLGEDISLLESGRSIESLRWRLALFALRLAFGWLSKRQGGLPNRAGSTPLKRAQQSDHCAHGTGEVTYYKQESERSFLHKSEGRLKPKSRSRAFCFTPLTQNKSATWAQHPAYEATNAFWSFSSGYIHFIKHIVS